MPNVTKTYTFSAGAVIIAAQHNTDFDTLYNLVNGALDGTNLVSNAAIVDTQLGQITTAGKVSGAALTGTLIMAKGTDVASGTTTNIGAATGNYIHVTGVTTITAFDTIAAGAWRNVTFDGILLLTHNGTSLILPSGANITTAANDTAVFVSEGSGNWRCLSYQRKSGSALIGTPVFTLSFTSSAQTITSAGQLVLAHSFGAVPKIVQMNLVNQSTEGNYGANDVVLVDNRCNSANGNRSLSTVVDATNITIRFGSDASAFDLTDKISGADFAITNNKWKLVVQAWA